MKKVCLGEEKWQRKIIDWQVVLVKSLFNEIKEPLLGWLMASFMA